MKFSTVAFGLAAISSVVAIPVDSELMRNARALVKRNRAGLPINLAKRNNDGKGSGSGGSSSGGSSGGITDVDIANFALQLEYRESSRFALLALFLFLSTFSRGSVLPHRRLRHPALPGSPRRYRQPRLRRQQVRSFLLALNRS